MSAIECLSGLASCFRCRSFKELTIKSTHNQRANGNNGESLVSKMLLFMTMLLTSNALSPNSSRADVLYLDRDQPIELRVEDLLARMTIEEKVNQLTSDYAKTTDRKNGPAPIDPQFALRLSQGLGSVQYVNLAHDAAQDVDFANSIQQYVRDKTRLGIPPLLEGEALHGLIAHKATTFPQAIALASTWDPDLVHRVYTLAGNQARSRGNHVMFTPLLDLARDPRWGRMEETYGEDVYLVTQMGLAAIRGLQGDGKVVGPGHVISAPKHFAAYGQCDGGRNFAPTSVPPRILKEEILEPFRQAVCKAHVWGLMPSHSEIDGVPAHGNGWLLGDILRKEWGFKGIVVSDYHDVHRLDILHHLCASQEDAALLALKTGVSLDQPNGLSYLTLLKSLRQRSEYLNALDDRVREVLRVKFMLGLFEEPFVDKTIAVAIQNNPENNKLALEAAEKSVILLKNSNKLLPLDRTRLKKIAIIGPNADETILGGYTHRMTKAQSIKDGLVNYLSDTSVEVMYSKGCGITSRKSFAQLETGNEDTHGIYTIPLEHEKESIADAAAIATECDVAVVVVGDNHFTSREAFYTRPALGDRGSIDLVGNQTALVRAIIETGTPTVVVLMHGRSLSINYIDQHADAILDGWYLGQETAQAICKTLFGENSPGGKLVVTVPRSSAHIPAYYSQRHSANWKDYLFENGPPLYSFGYGLSYTKFSLENIRLSSQVAKIGETIAVSLDVSNVGKMDGDEVVQVYVRDLVASTTRPNIALKAFKRVSLKPNETKKVQLNLTPSAFEMINLDYDRVIEPGEFKVLVGTSSRQQDLTELDLVLK